MTVFVPSPTSRYSLDDIIALWGDRVTDGDPKSQPRYDELVADKTRTISEFFDFVEVPPNQVTSVMVGEYVAMLQQSNLAEGTIYKSVCRVSSFYQWAMKEKRSGIQENPVTPLVRPKSPKPYQSEQIKSLTDQQLVILINHVDELRATAGKAGYQTQMVARRDHAILMFFVFTGKRLSEIINLHWGDLTFEGDTMYIFAKHKGGIYASTEVQEVVVREALDSYLFHSGRKGQMKAESPLWLRHDRASDLLNAAMGRHGWHKRMKKYCRDAGLGDVHTHQLRDTFARIVSEETGDMKQVQTALGHANEKTTVHYVNRVAVRRDVGSKHVRSRLFGGKKSNG